MMNESEKNFFAFVLAQNCLQHGEEGCGCTLMNVEKIISCSEGCPFKDTYVYKNGEMTKICDSEIKCSSEVHNCFEVTPEHWKLWLEKYKEVISK